MSTREGRQVIVSRCGASATVCRASDADRVEGGAHGLGFGAAVAVEVAGGALEAEASVDELALAGEVGAECAVVDLFRLLASNGLDDEHRGFVGNARVDVDAAVVLVLGKVLEVAHVCRLRREHVRIVGVLDIAQCHGSNRDVLAGEEVVAVDHDSEDVSERLVERAGLVLVHQVGGVLDHAVRHLVASDIQGAGEGLEQPVSVAPRHDPAVPEGIVHRPPVLRDVDDGDHGLVRVVDGLASEGVEEIGVGELHAHAGRDSGRVAERAIRGRDVRQLSVLVDVLVVGGERECAAGRVVRKLRCTCVQVVKVREQHVCPVVAPVDAERAVGAVEIDALPAGELSSAGDRRGPDLEVDVRHMAGCVDGAVPRDLLEDGARASVHHHLEGLDEARVDLEGVGEMEPIRPAVHDQPSGLVLEVEPVGDIGGDRVPAARVLEGGNGAGASVGRGEGGRDLEVGRRVVGPVDGVDRAGRVEVGDDLGVPHGHALVLLLEANVRRAQVIGVGADDLEFGGRVVEPQCGGEGVEDGFRRGHAGGGSDGPSES